VIYCLQKSLDHIITARQQEDGTVEEEVVD